MGLLGVLALVSVGVAGAGPGGEPVAGGVRVGDKAPAFSLNDVDGKAVSLADFAGKVVVLEWINRHCPFSRGKHNDRVMQKAVERLKGKEVVWLAIDSSHYANPDQNRKYARKQGLTYPILHDKGGKVGKAYGARTTPHMFVIDKQGVVVYAGAIDDAPPRTPKANPRNYVVEAVEAVLAGRAVRVSTTQPYGCSVKYEK